MISCTVMISSWRAPIMIWNCFQPKRKRHERILAQTGFRIFHAWFDFPALESNFRKSTIKGWLWMRGFATLSIFHGLHFTCLQQRVEVVSFGFGFLISWHFSTSPGFHVGKGLLCAFRNLTSSTFTTQLSIGTTVAWTASIWTAAGDWRCSGSGSDRSLSAVARSGTTHWSGTGSSRCSSF